jgi:acetyltransferase-like isoleucine patch superfamily enzyme
MMLRSLLNSWRRRLWHALFFRIVFGERGRPNARIAPSTCIEGEAGLQLADHVFIGQFNFIDATAGLTIAEGVQITNFVSIVTHSSHRSIRLLGRSYASSDTAEVPGYVKGPIRIGAYSFIGPHSLIEAGALIGKGVVVCAHSQVRGTVPDFAIVAGVPAVQVGDVRVRDAQLLAQSPELAVHYKLWAEEAPQ